MIESVEGTVKEVIHEIQHDIHHLHHVKVGIIRRGILRKQDDHVHVTAHKFPKTRDSAVEMLKGVVGYQQDHGTPEL